MKALSGVVVALASMIMLSHYSLLINGFAVPTTTTTISTTKMSRRSINELKRMSIERMKGGEGLSMMIHYGNKEVDVVERTILRATASIDELTTTASQQTLLDSSATSSPSEAVALPTNTSLASTTHQTTETPAATTSKEASKVPFPLVVWRFTRPHTLIGSALAIPSLYLLAAPSLASLGTLNSLLGLVYALVPSLLMNLYITGLNQITDVDIDKVNKPNLPIPSGQLSIHRAKQLVWTSLFLSLGMGHFIQSPGLLVALWGSALLGTMYSLPPFRLKRFPFLAAFCIIAVRGLVINASFYTHAQQFLTTTTTTTFMATSSSSSSFLSSMIKSIIHPLVTVTQTCWNDALCKWSSLYFCIFGMVIALMKDVPDVQGDIMAGVRTFSVRIGQAQIFRAAQNVLQTLLYLYAAAFFRRGIITTSSSITTTTRILKLVRFWGLTILCGLASRSIQRDGRNVDPTNSRQVYQHYMHLWKIFYASYIVLPFC